LKQVIAWLHLTLAAVTHCDAPFNIMPARWYSTMAALRCPCSCTKGAKSAAEQQHADDARNSDTRALSEPLRALTMRRSHNLGLSEKGEGDNSSGSSVLSGIISFSFVLVLGQQCRECVRNNNIMKRILGETLHCHQEGGGQRSAVEKNTITYSIHSAGRRRSPPSPLC
jgi:hypothetical protein